MIYLPTHTEKLTEIKSVKLRICDIKSTTHNVLQAANTLFGINWKWNYDKDEYVFLFSEEDDRWRKVCLTGICYLQFPSEIGVSHSRALLSLCINYVLMDAIIYSP